jgi:hypothetical protein
LKKKKTEQKEETDSNFHEFDSEAALSPSGD